jgi:hypothetical protein
VGAGNEKKAGGFAAGRPQWPSLKPARRVAVAAALGSYCGSCCSCSSSQHTEQTTTRVTPHGTGTDARAHAKTAGKAGRGAAISRLGRLAGVLDGLEGRRS